MTPELKKVIGIFGAWILLAAILWFFLPEDWHVSWIAYIPLILIVVAIAAAAIGLILMRFGLFKPITARVNHCKVRSCLFCPARSVSYNPVNPDFPICKCKDKGMRTCYNPRKVPRWCPHVVR